MKVELSFHDSTTRQVVKQVDAVIYKASVVVISDQQGVKWSYPLCSVHRIKEIPG